VDATIDELTTDRGTESGRRAIDTVRPGCEREVVQAHVDIVGIRRSRPFGGVEIS
jgi:hypothetical protein